MVRWIAPLIALLAVGWVAVLLSAPFLPTLVAALTYAFGSLICHQIPERSFHLQGFQLPVCARCLGIYSGAAFAAAWMSMPATWLPRTGQSLQHPRLVTVAAAMPTVVTVALEWAGLWRPSNVTRAVAGAPLGIAVAFVVMRALRTTKC